MNVAGLNTLYTSGRKVMINSELGRLFRKIGRPIARGATLGAPSPDELPRIAKTCERYGYWVATPERNASVGIPLSGQRDADSVIDLDVDYSG
jgi:hypothetical protein